jgi:hypothetical protein
MTVWQWLYATHPSTAERLSIHRSTIDQPHITPTTAQMRVATPRVAVHRPGEALLARLL